MYEKRVRPFVYRSEEKTLNCNAHMHRHIEFVYIRGGEYTAHADSESYTLEADDLFISFPNQVHRFEAKSNEAYDLFIVDPELTPELSSFFANTVPKSNVLHNVSENEFLYSALKGLVAAAKSQKEELREQLIKGHLLVLFSHLFEVMSLVPYKKGDGNTLRIIVDYCANHFTEDLSLASLEESLHISRHYISHLFGEKLNIGFNDYINTLRVTFAARLLRETDDAIIDISEIVGFNSLRTFNRAFKKHMGYAPREYRSNKDNKPRTYARSASL